MTNLRLTLTWLAVSGLSLLAGTASAAASDLTEDIREIYVPLDEFNLILEEQRAGVLLSRQEYESLLQDASPRLPEAPVPCATTVVSADYRLTVGRDRAEIAGTLILDVLEAGLRTIELEVDHVGVRRAQLDGSAAPLVRSGPDGLTLFAEGPGRHELTLDLTAAVETAAAQQTLTFRLPTPPASRVTMTVPGNVEIKSGAAVVSRVFDETAELTRFELLPQTEHRRVVLDEGNQSSRVDPPPATGTVSLVMTLNNRLLQAQRAVTARAVLVDEITATYERLHATFLMTVLHQAVDRFRFVVPEGFDVTDVQSPLLSQWAIIAEPSRNVLEVRLRESTTESVVVGVSALRTEGVPAAWTLPRFSPLDVVGEAAVVGLLLEDRLSLQSLTTDTLIPIDTSVITNALSGMMFGGEPGAPPLRAVAAFYSPTGSEGFDAKGVFRQPAGRLLVTTHLLLALADAELRVQGGFALKPAIEPLFHVEIDVPEGWHVLSVTDAEGAAAPFEILDAAGAGAKVPARVRVAFPGGVAPGTQRSIYFQAVHTPAGWLSKWSSTPVTFPAFAVRGAQREVGAIAVESGDEMVAYPDVVEGLTPLDDADKAEYGLSAVTASRQAPAFRFEQQPFHATFRVERTAPRLTAKTYSFLRIEPHLLSAHYEVAFGVDRARTDTLSLSLPASTPADVSITGLEGVTVKEFESAPAGDRRRWTVHLAEPRRDAVRLAVEFDQPLDASQAVEFTLPMLRAEDVAYQSGVVAIEGSAELDLETKSTLRRVDVGELAGAVHQPPRGAAGGLGVFAHVGDDPAVVAVRVVCRAPYGLPTAIVQRAEIDTSVSASGAAQTAVRLLLRTSAAFLEVDLPSASELWSAEIDGRPLQPQREGQRLLLSLPAADRLLDVRVVYHTAIERIGFWSDIALAPPRFSVRGDGGDADRSDVPAADMRWNVYLPAGFRLADYAGTATTAPLPSPEPAAWSVARLLWRGTGGFHPFYHNFLPSLSRARELSSRPNARSFYRLEESSASASRVADSTVGEQLEPATEEDSREVRTPPPKTAPPQAEPRSAPSSKAGSPAAPSPKDYWALEGVRSLKIELDRSGPVVAFSSLGVDPRLRLTLTHERRTAALGWGLALAAFLFGMVLTRRPARTRALYVAVVATAATVIPMLFGGAELTRVANPAFYAVMLLIPFYVAVRIVRWIAANARRPIRLRAATAAVLGLALLPTAKGQPPSDKGTHEAPVVVEIAEPLPPIELPDDAVVVPYDPSAAPGRDDAPAPGHQVLLPYALFQALWSAAYPQAAPIATAAPAPFAFAGGAFSAVLGEDDELKIDGYLEIVVYADGVVAVPLLLTDAVLSHAVLDGHPAQLGSPAAGRPPPPGRKAELRDATSAPFTLLVEGKGPHRLDLSATLRVTREGGWRVAQGRIPSAPGTALTLRIPDAGTEVRLESVQDRRSYETHVSDETIAAALGPDGAIHVRWRPRISEGSSESSLTAASEAVLDVREDGLRLVWKLALDSGRGEHDAYRLILPRDYLIHAIGGPNVRGWNRSESDEQEVTVSLLQPSKGTQTITVVLHRRGDLASAQAAGIEAPVVRVIGAALQNGRLTIRRSVLLDLAADSASGVNRIDTPGEAKKLVALAPDAMASPLGMVVYQSYQFASLPFAIELSAKPAASDGSARLQSLLRIGERRRTLETRLTITPRRSPVYDVRVAIPKDFQVEHVETSGSFEWAVSDDPNRTLMVRLTTGQDTAFPIVVRGTLGPEGPLEQLTLPVITVIGAASQGGEVAIQTDPAFDLAVETIRNCLEIPLDQVFVWLTPPQRPLTRVALSHSGDGYEARLRITPRRPDVACTTITNVRVTESTIEETLLLDFDITQTGIREIAFVLPHSLKDARILVPMLRQKTIEPLAGEPESPVRVRLTLQDEIMGHVRVLIENDRALGAEAFRVPFATVETGRTHRRYAAFESAGRDEVEVASLVGLEPLTHSQSEWQTLTKLVGSALTQAYVATGDDSELMLRTRERAMVETAGARIGLARAVFVADAGGAYRATQSYRMDNRTEPFLEVILPEGAALWSVQVAGELVKPAGVAGITSDRRVRIPLIKSAAGELDYEVTLKYAGQLPHPGALRTVDFPLLRAANVAVELSQVSLFLPQELRWFDFGGTMRRVDDEAELAAGFIRYQTRLAERLEQTLESESPFARIRASASLEEVESQSEQIRREVAGYRLNAGLVAELESNRTVVGRASAQQQQRQTVQQSGQAGESLDNRAKLDVLYEKQQVARARNQVQELADNFLAPPPPEEEKEAASTFDREWLSRNSLSDAPGDESEAGTVEDRLDRDDSARLRQQAVQPEGPQFAQQAAEGARDAAQSDEKPATVRGLRAAGTDELAQQYRAKMEQPVTSLGATLQTPSGGQAGRGGAMGQPVVLTELAVDFPLRGDAFHFTTPRGEVSITARAVSRSFLSGLTRLGLTLLAVTGFVLAYLLFARFAPRELLGPAGATAMIVLGAISVLTGILPVVGVLAVIGGLVARKRLRPAPMATTGWY